MNWLRWAGLVLRATAAGIAAGGRPKWNDTALIVRVWSHEPGQSTLIGEALVQKEALEFDKDGRKPSCWSGGDNGFSVSALKRRDDEALAVLVWSGTARESDIITTGLATRNGCGWKDRANGFSIHRTRRKDLVS